MNRNKLGIAIVGGVATLSLIGVGAGASFTDKASASQSVTRGGINLLMSTDNSNFAKSVTFTDPGPLTSAAATWNQTLTLANTGSLDVHLTGALLSETGTTISITADYPNLAPGQPVGLGDNLIPAGLVTIPAHGTVSVPMHFSIPASDTQNTVSTALLVVHGTD